MTKLGLKVLTVFAITIGLVVPLMLIRGLISERTRYRAEARDDIARSWTGAQNVVGPILVIPPHHLGGSTEAEQSKCLFVLPETLDIQASLQTKERKRGLYALPVYSTRLAISGEFDLSSVAPAGEAPWAHLDLDAATLALSLTDNRGIVEQPTLVWGGEVHESRFGSSIPTAQGVHAEVGPLHPDTNPRYPFRIEIELRGMETLQFAPVGADTRVMLDAGWSHPSFVGRFLPVEHEIGDERFTAVWRVSGLASGRQTSWFGTQDAASAILGTTFGVSLINPVDIYQQATRSVKYGNLIVLLTFTSFFLVELVRKLTLHPMQYLLIGLALVIFFLLLLALSEHMGFGLAYLVASIACVGLIAVYISSALGSPLNGAVVTGTMGGLFGMLYAILRSEDNALLMGSILLFFALTAVMLVTRRIDWYRLGHSYGLVKLTAEAKAGE